MKCSFNHFPQHICLQICEDLDVCYLKYLKWQRWKTRDSSGAEGWKLHCFLVRSQEPMFLRMCFGLICLSSFLTVHTVVGGVYHFQSDLTKVIFGLQLHGLQWQYVGISKSKGRISKIITYNFKLHLSDMFFLACKELSLPGEAETIYCRILYCLLLPVYVCSSSKSSNSKRSKSTMECLALFPLSCVLLCFILGFLICSCSREAQLLD